MVVAFMLHLMLHFISALSYIEALHISTRLDRPIAIPSVHTKSASHPIPSPHPSTVPDPVPEAQRSCVLNAPEELPDEPSSPLHRTPCQIQGPEVFQFQGIQANLDIARAVAAA
ncbi:hypothetical protein EDB81DRAFT_779587, partial [Dactylonectria macrodidyma]